MEPAPWEMTGIQCHRALAVWMTDGCDPPCSCWELNSEPLQKQPALLTNEPPLLPLASSSSF
uniref:Bm11720 n=1 Tax=Brugia malayi TaxID=6279 RepID=A0A1I9GBJ6_BRUMA|nr:Bm11720 [Brugia malayi]